MQHTASTISVGDCNVEIKQTSDECFVEEYEPHNANTLSINVVAETSSIGIPIAKLLPVSDPPYVKITRQRTSSSAKLAVIKLGKIFGNKLLKICILSIVGAITCLVFVTAYILLRSIGDVSSIYIGISQVLMDCPSYAVIIALCYAYCRPGRLRSIVIMVDMAASILMAIYTLIIFSVIPNTRSYFVLLISGYTYFLLLYLGTCILIAYHETVKYAILIGFPAVVAVVTLMFCDYTLFPFYDNANDTGKILIRIFIYPCVWSLVAYIGRYCLSKAVQYKKVHVSFLLCMTIIPIYMQNYFSHIATIDMKSTTPVVITCATTLITSHMFCIIKWNRHKFIVPLLNKFDILKHVNITIQAGNIEKTMDTDIIKNVKLASYLPSFSSIVDAVSGVYITSDSFYKAYIILSTVANVIALVSVSCSFYIVYAVDIGDARDINDVKQTSINIGIIIFTFCIDLPIGVLLQHIHNFDLGLMEKLSIKQLCMWLVFICAIGSSQTALRTMSFFNNLIKQ